MNVKDSCYSLYCTVIPDSGFQVLGLPLPGPFDAQSANCLNRAQMNLFLATTLLSAG